MKACCLCKEVVLEIPGYDTFLDSVFLSEEEIDRCLIEDGCLGDVHLSCLSQSRWRAVWTNRQLSNLQDVRKLPTRQVFDGGFVSWNDRTSECCLLRHGGVQWMPIDAIDRLGPNECVVDLTAEVTWDVASKLSQILLSTFRKGRTYPLQEMLGLLLSAKGKLQYASVLQGLVKPFSDDPESTLESLEDGVFDGEIEYQYRLEEPFVSVIKELANQDV